MRKSLLSMLLCFCVMRLAVAAGAEEGIRSIVERLEQNYGISEADYATLSSGAEFAQVGDEGGEIAGYIGVGGESALNLGEDIRSEVQEVSFLSELSLRNDSARTVDVDALLHEGPDLRLAGDEMQILIIHTHGSEAYTQSPGAQYEESDPYRTEDKTKNVVKVGDVLAETLEKKGLGVIHDREIYDHPSYTGSYSRSGSAVEDYLKKYPGIKVVIDLHRDALGSGDTVYKTRADTSLGECAQVMLLVGTGDNGLYHPAWEENLRLALYLQNAIEQRYPGLSRPLALKSERYNQHLSTGSMIIEVGSTGNTLPEALKAIELFGDAAGDALKKLVVEE